MPDQPPDHSSDRDALFCTERKFRLLVVDDDPDIGELLIAGLGAVGGCDVQVAGDAGAALLVMDREDAPFDGIFLDIQLPGTTGIELCAIIRGTPGYADVPIIMLTAMAEQTYLKDAFAKGANDYITKPFDLDELNRKLAKQRTGRLRRNRFKGSQHRNEVSGTTSDREVIRALEDAVRLRGVERCLTREAFHEFLLQSNARFAAPVSVKAIKIAHVYDLFSQIPEGKYLAIVTRIAKVLSGLTNRTEDVFSYFGNGIFVTTVLRKSVIDRISLSRAMEDEGDLDDLASYYLSLHLICGPDVAVRSATKAGVVFALGSAIDAAEATEASYWSWGTFVEWMSQKKSIGREQYRMDQANYESILEDFIESGELGWKKDR